MFTDLKFAFRQLRKNPGFTAVAVITLALGIGANTAIFSLVNSVLLKPLPYEHPGQLVQIWESGGPGSRNAVSPGAFLDWKEHNTVFESVSLRQFSNMNITGTGEPELIGGLGMSAGGLQILRARPLLGRLFTPEEDRSGSDKVVVLGYGFWQRRFGGATNIVGKAIQLNGEGYTVVGVLPRHFWLWDNSQFVVPANIAPGDVNQRSAHWLQVFGRLKPGVTIDQAQVEMTALMKRLKPLYPSYKKDWGVMLVPMHEQFTGDIRPTVLILAGAVGFVLLIACANVANLLLAKASERQKEMAIRTALGAGRWRVIRQLLAESMLLSLCGAVLGVMLAYWSVGAFNGQSAVQLPQGKEIDLDLQVLGFALVLSVAAGVAFGLVPALQASRTDLNNSLKDGVRSSATGSQNRVRSGLIVAEVALSLVLLVGTGLLLNSFVRLMNISPGINPRNALAMYVSLPQKKYPDAARRAAFFEQAVERIGALPQVEAVGAVEMPPLANWGQSSSFTIVGRANQPESGNSTAYNFCTPDYFKSVGIPLIKGRFFNQRDNRAGAVRTVVISEALARQYFPNEDPLGHQIHLEVFTGKVDEGWEIIGVAGDIHQSGLDDSISPCVYRPLAFAWGANWHLMVRTAGAPMSLADSVRKAILEIDPDQPVSSVRTLEELVDASLSQRRFTMLLLGAFAVSALLLAAVGLYGVIAYSVSQRTREIGIRTALGATQANVLSLVLRQGMMLAGIGVLLGIAGALGLTRVLRDLLFEVKPADPLTFGGVSFMLLFVTFLASWLPARRATKIDPIAALRHE